MRNCVSFLILLSFLTEVSAQDVKPIVQFGHLGAEIKEVVLSGDGSLMATTDGEIIKLWDLNTGLEIRSLAEEPGINRRIAQIGLSYDGRVISYAYGDRVVLRNTEDGTFIRHYPPLSSTEGDDKVSDEEGAKQQAQRYANQSKSLAVAFHPKKKEVAIMLDERIEIRSLDGDLLVQSIPRFGQQPSYGMSPRGFRFSADGKTLLSSTGRVSIVGNRSVGHTAPTIEVKDNEMLRLGKALLSPDDKFVATLFATAEHEDTIQQRIIRQFEEAVRQDSSALIAELDEEELTLRDQDYKHNFTLYASLIAKIEQAEMFEERTSLLVSNAQTSGMVHTIEAARIADFAISPDSRKVVTTHSDGRVVFWELANGKKLSTIDMRKEAGLEDVEEVDLSSQLIEGDGFYKSFQLKMLSKYLKRPPAVSPKIVFTHDGENVIIVAKFEEGENMGIWNVETGHKVTSIGANIPLVDINITKVASKEISMREYVHVMRDMDLGTDAAYTFLTPQYKVEKELGYRMLDLANGKVPAAFPTEDTVVYSPRRDFYLFQMSGNLPEVRSTELNNERTAYLEGCEVKLRNVCFSYDGKYVAGSHSNTFMVWEVQTGRKIYTNARHELPVIHLSFDPNNRYLASCGEDDRVGFWDVEDKDAKEPVAGIGRKFDEKLIVRAFHNRGKILEDAKDGVSVLKDWDFRKKNPQSGETKLEQNIKSVEGVNQKTYKAEDLLRFKGGYMIDYSENGRYATVWLNNYAAVQVFDLEQEEESGGRLRNALKKSRGITKLGDVTDYYLVAAQKLFFGGRRGDTMSTAGSAAQHAMFYSQIKNRHNLRNISTFSSDYQRIASYRTTYSISKGEEKAKKTGITSRVKRDKGIRIQCVKNKGCEELWLEDSEGFNEGLAFSGDYIAASSRTSNTIGIWNANTGELIKTIKGHSGQLRFSSNGKVLFSSGWDRQVKAFDFDSGEELYSFIGIKGSNDYVVILPDGYYTASRRNSKAVAYAKGNKAYPFEQFDLAFNRPDLLVAKFGEAYQQEAGPNPNTELVKAYRQAYVKRLENLGFSEETFSVKDIHLPEATMGQLPVSTAKTKISVSVDAKDDLYNLDRLQIYVNDVPLFGTKGLDLTGSAKKTYRGEHEIELLNGLNKVQVSVFNAKGAESLRETASVVCTAPAVKPNLYLVLAGTATFQEDAMNLGSPINDLKAMESLFMQKAGEYGEIIPIRLYGEDFTRERFQEIKARLAGTTIHDRVVVMVATHGVLNPSNYDYYLATYDTDFKNPQEQALPYREIENLIDGIKARHRLAFIDACHAGELDTLSLQNLERITKFRTEFEEPKLFRASAWNEIGYQTSFDFMKDLFIDLRRNSGATIIGSARGADLAIDGGYGRISPFTHALIAGLDGGNADEAPFDGKITVSELQNYLGKKVQILTGGVQKPIYRVENVSNDWSVW
jgi:WD40 repeat protein